MFEKKWFRLLLNVVLGAALVIGVYLGLIGLKSPMVSFSMDNAFFGEFAFMGTFFFFLAVDILQDYDKTVIGILRLIFMIIGMLLVVAGGLLSLITTISDATKEVVTKENPWLFGFATPWLLSGVLSFLLYCYAEDNEWNESLYPVIPVLSFIGCYILCVIFTYIGNAAGSFFYGWLPLILSVGGIVWVIIELKEGGLPFDILSSKHTVVPHYQSDSATSGNSSSQSQKSQSDNMKLDPFIEKLKSRLYDKIVNEKQLCLPFLGKNKYTWLNFSPTVTCTAYSIKIEGTLGCEAHSDSVNHAEDYARSDANDVKKKIKKKAEKIRSAVYAEAKSHGVDVSNSALSSSIDVKIDYRLI